MTLRRFFGLDDEDALHQSSLNAIYFEAAKRKDWRLCTLVLLAEGAKRSEIGGLLPGCYLDNKEVDAITREFPSPKKALAEVVRLARSK